MWCKYGHIVEDIHKVLKAFRRWEIEHVNRKVIGAAHGLAKAAIREVGERIWIEETPS